MDAMSQPAAADPPAVASQPVPRNDNRSPFYVLYRDQETMPIKPSVFYRGETGGNRVKEALKAILKNAFPSGPDNDNRRFEVYIYIHANHIFEMRRRSVLKDKDQLLVVEKGCNELPNLCVKFIESQPGESINDFNLSFLSTYLCVF